MRSFSTIDMITIALTHVALLEVVDHLLARSFQSRSTMHLPSTSLRPEESAELGLGS